MSITLKQIAALAGVHKSTVDKVIHNRPGVSEAKRQQIRRLLDEYGYESNPLAKALNYQKKKMKVAVVLPTVDAQPILKQGMELVRQDFNSFNVEVEYYEMPFSDAEGQARCLRKLSTTDVSGIVLLPIEAPVVIEAMKALQEAKIPVVVVNSDLEDAPHLCFVGQDMEQAGRIAARMFDLCMPQGGTLGIISSQNMRAVKQRECAFKAYLGENFSRISIAEAVDIKESSEDAYLQTIGLLERHPELDALFITCGRVPDICRAIRDKGMQGKLTVMCYEKYPEIATLVRDGEIACTISGDLAEQGRLAMRLLFQNLIYEHEPKRKIFYTKNEILLKENIINK
ncbi:MAG: LacI family DNA-binding transcriptional regulator [Eubacteriales bacterium]|nr:LacI family DNA-binding transcriptional regulator [Eubacteriales bacterium]